MKPSRWIVLVLTLVAGSLLLTACGGGAPVNNWAGVTADQGTVYLAYNTGIFAVDAKNGEQIWRYPQKADGGKIFYAAPVLTEDGQLIAGNYAGALQSLDAKTGAEKWSFSETKGRFVASPQVTKNMVLAPNGDWNLYALDLNGKLLWTFTAKQSLWAQPAVDAERVYVPGMDHSLYAVNLADGKMVWSAKLGGSMVATPLVTKDAVYVSTLAGELAAFDLKGTQLWKKSVDKPLWVTPVLVDDLLIVGDQGGTLYALSVKDGSETWKLSAGSAVVGSGVVFGQTVVFPTEGGEVVAVNSKGEKVWTRSVKSGNLFSNPALNSERLFVPVLDGDKLLVTYDPAGNEQWSYAVPK